MEAEADIVQRLKEKDAEAFGSLYNIYAPALYRLIQKLTADNSVAVIILEKSFLAFRLQIKYFDSGKDRLFTWMVRITIKKCKDLLWLTNESVIQKLGLRNPSDRLFKPNGT